MNVPKLRFKEFSNDWKDEKLEDVVDFLDDRRKPIKDSDRNNIKGIYPYYGASGIIDYINDYIFDEELLLLGEDGANILSRSTQLVFKATGKYWVNNHAHVLRPKENYNIDFLESCLENINYEPYNTGTAQPKLNQEVCRKINIKTPSLKEQVKIGKTLSLLDKKIELQTKKIEILKLFKSYTKSEIFKNGNHVCKLGAILNKWNKKNKDGAINYVESISNKAGFIPQSEQFEDRNVASKNLSNYYVIKKGVFGYNPSRLNVGSLALKENDFISVVSPLYECFTTTQNNTYLFEWFNSNNFKKETFSKFEGGVRNTLNFNNLCDIPINLPDIETQNQYAKYFNKINFKISLEEQKLSELVKFKKGLLQEMFI